MFRLVFTTEAMEQLRSLKKNPAQLKRFKSVRKALGLLQINPRNPGLNTHKYISIQMENRADVFEAYAENNTPGAYRIFWHYGEGKDVITIIIIV